MAIEERIDRLEAAIIQINEKLAPPKPSAFDDLIEADLLKAKLGNPHPTTWWRWEKKGLLGNPVVLGTKKMYKLSEILLLQSSNNARKMVHVR